MISRVVACICWLSAAGLLVGCGKSENGAAPIAREQLPRAVADLLCDSLAPCCRDAGQAFDVAQCKTALTAQFGAIYDEQLGARVEYDAAAAGDCISAARLHTQCGEVDDDGEDIEACDNIFRGTVAAGQPCESSQECRRDPGQDVSCNYDDVAGISTCQVYAPQSQPRGKAGDYCNGTCYDPDGGLCDGSVAPSGPSTPSTPPAICYVSDDLYCAYDQTTLSQTCAAVASAGEPCSSAGDNCGHGSQCDYATGLCTLPKPDGQPCDSGSLCQSDFCSEQGVCAPRTVTAEDCSVESIID